MNDVTNLPPTSPAPELCTGCGKEVESSCSVCPHCGLQLKSTENLSQRERMWVFVILVFVVTEVLIGLNSQNWAIGIGLFVGLPLFYVFGKDVSHRMQGRPLTSAELRKISSRAFLTSFVLLILTPVAAVIYIALACAGSAGR